MNILKRLFKSSTVIKADITIAPITNQQSVQRRIIDWLALIPTDISYDMFNEAWKRIFNHYLSECKVTDIFNDGSNVGFDVKTPSAHHSHGGFGYHTSNPKLDNIEDIWYTGGISWDIDNDGNRFYYLNRSSGLPAMWEDVKATEIIRRYIITNQSTIDNITTKLLS